MEIFVYNKYKKKLLYLFMKNKVYVGPTRDASCTAGSPFCLGANGPTIFKK